MKIAGRIIFLACLIFGASQAFAATSHNDDARSKSTHKAFDIKHTGNRELPQEDAKIFAPSAVASLHCFAVPNALPELTILSVLNRHTGDPQSFIDQSPPLRKLFKELFRVVIAPNAP